MVEEATIEQRYTQEVVKPVGSRALWSLSVSLVKSYRPHPEIQWPSEVLCGCPCDQMATEQARVQRASQCQ